MLCPVICFSSTFHNLCKRVASVAYALKVPLTKIRYAGGDSTNFIALESKYMDYTLRPTHAALLFFIYVKKDIPV
jgi:hypothetical protein